MRSALDDGVVESAAHRLLRRGANSKVSLLAVVIEFLSTSRLGMRRMYGFRFRRPSLSEVHREPDHRGNRQKLALPVLKRLKPELRGAHELQHGNCVAAVQALIYIELQGPTRGMHREGKQEKDEKDNRQGTLIDPQHPSPAPHGPRCIAFAAKEAGISIHGFGCSDLLGF
jgi:hypothetical protein